MASWMEISELLKFIAQIRRAEWGCELPPFDSLPSESLELIIDDWCSKLAANLNAPLTPPPEVKPWMLARLLSMSASAATLAQSGDVEAPQLSPQTVRQFLIGEWNGCLRDRWPLIMKLEK